MIKLQIKKLIKRYPFFFKINFWCWITVNFFILIKFWKFWIVFLLSVNISISLKIILQQYIILQIRTWKLMDIIYMHWVNNFISLLDQKKNWPPLFYTLFKRMLFVAIFGIPYKYISWVITIYKDFIELSCECENKIWWMQIYRVKWSFISSLKKEFIPIGTIQPQKNYTVFGKNKKLIIILYTK